MQNHLEVKTEVLSTSYSRREFLRGLTTAVAGLVWVGAARGATAIGSGSTQLAGPIDVVRAFCAAWSKDASTAELAAFLTDDAVYHNMMMDPVSGKAAIANNFATFIRPGAPNIETLHLRIMNIAANGPVVLTERVDSFKTPNRSFDLPVMGTFEIRDGKIKAWRDYFDLGTFTKRMG